MRLRTAISKTGCLSGRIRFAKFTITCNNTVNCRSATTGITGPTTHCASGRSDVVSALSQYLTPDATARRIAALAVRYFENDSRIMDVCCGTGQLTRALIAEGVHPSQIVGLEVDRELADFYARLYPVTQTLIGPYRDIDFRCENVVANPPFETTEVVDFLSWLAKVQQPGDRSVLLLPHGFIDKQRPKGIQETLRQFKVLYRTPMQERFARTNVIAEIVVLERR